MTVKCNHCPHPVGDCYENDCEFPECVGGWKIAFQRSEREKLAIKADLETALDIIVDESGPATDAPRNLLIKYGRDNPNKTT